MSSRSTVSTMVAMWSGSVGIGDAVMTTVCSGASGESAST
jgi:hypothetical protein